MHAHALDARLVGGQLDSAQQVTRLDRRDHPVGSRCHELSHCQRAERGIDNGFTVTG